MTQRFFIETFGCQMNELDSEKIAGHLCRAGMEPVSDARQAELVVLNTCSIREKAVQKVYARLGELRRLRDKDNRLMVGVVGCMAQLEGAHLLRRAPFVDLVAGPQKGHLLPELLQQRLASGATAIDLRIEDDPEPLETTHVLRESRWRAGVTISEGCSRHCAFCVVPRARGPQRDRGSENIVREIEGLAGAGYLEVTLLGQTVTSYRDPSRALSRFPSLLRRLSEIDGLERIRFAAPHPGDFTTELLGAMVSCEKVCDHIHLPVQSGSNRILRAMRRGYSRERYLRAVDLIKNASRPIAVSTDVIVGFPGETDEDFEATMSLLDTVQFDGVFSFKYSPRPNTSAFGRADEVPEGTKARRLRVLQEQQKLIQYNRNSAYMGRVVSVLVDNRAKTNFSLSGRTGNNKIVNFDGPDELLGRIVPVEVTGFSPNSLKGSWQR